MASDDELLRRYKPRLKYDSQENYFADSPAVWTDSPTNVLRRADGQVLAYAKPAQGQHALGLDLLRDGTYPDPVGGAVASTDAISHPDDLSLKRYQDLHRQNKYANRMYGLVVDGAAARWLQYWFFYYYNDAPNTLIEYGKHEGDWEMIQLRLSADDVPNRAVYAQHKHAGQRDWDDVEKTDAGRPVVYPARGSHASYFKPGRYNALTDRADGLRPTPQLRLDVVTHDSPSWVTWPGVWGDTSEERVLGQEVGETSPRGPCKHKQWIDPDALLERPSGPVERPEVAAPPPDPVSVEVTRRRDRAAIKFALSAGQIGTARELLVTVNSPDDDRPPTTLALPIDRAAGTVEWPEKLDPGHAFDVHVSTHNGEGITSDARRRELAAVR
jgi:hypothetical protein